MTNVIRKAKTTTEVKVKLEPEVMEVAARAIYDGLFLTSREVNESKLIEIGFNESDLAKYLKMLVKIRVGLITGQVKGASRSDAKNLYVPAGIAQILVAIGEVEVGSYTIVPDELSGDEFAEIDWKFAQSFSDTLLRMRQILTSVKNILIPERSGDVDVMALVVSKSDDRDATLAVHANADVNNLHPVKQAFALLAGIKLVKEHLEILYPNELVVDDYRSALEDVFSKKIDQ